MQRISSPAIPRQQAQSSTGGPSNTPVKTLDIQYYNTEPAVAPVPLPKELDPSNSTPSTPRSESPPPRLKPRVRNKQPIKGILKPPTQLSTKFNFRRDILQPLNSRLISTAYGTTAPEGSSTIASGAAGTVPGSPTGNAAQGGGFWGSAMKRLSVATIAASDAAAGVSARVIADVTGLEKPPTPTSASPSPITTTTTPAPNTPSRGLATSSVASTSSIATIRSSASSYVPPVAPPAPPALSVGELKKVSFRMSALRVIYPIGPTAPWEEGRTKKRVNNEYRAARLRSSQGGPSRGWTGEALLRLYGECCRTREEMGIERVKRALRVSSSFRFRDSRC